MKMVKNCKSSRKVTLLLLLVFFSFTLCAKVFEAEDISNSPTLFESTVLPQDEDGKFLNRYMPSVGNGHISTTVFSDSVYMNGLYNGYKGESHRARIPSLHSIRPIPTDEKLIDSIKNRTFSIDVEKGIFFEKFFIEGFNVESRIFAHRYYHKVIVNQIYVNPLKSSGTKLELKLMLNKGNQSLDIEFDQETEFEADVPSKYSCGKTLQVEDPRYQPTNPAVCIVYSDIPEKIQVSKAQTFTYITSYDRTLQGAAGDYTAVASLIHSGNQEEIYETHVNAWKQLWNEGRIEVEDNLELSKVVYGCLYYILSSLPVTGDTYSAVGQFYGMSPGGLANGGIFQDFQGHSFWDTEIFIFPVIAYFHSEMAREILNYRLYSVKAARDKAIETKYKGARFAWEGGVTGSEVTPECCTETRDFEVHITGDIAFAIKQYIAITRDFGWLRQTQPNFITNGGGLIREIAEFWISRFSFNATTGFHDLNNVLPPDGDNHVQNNNGYTNAMASYSIFFAKYAECLCNGSMQAIPDKWIKIAKSLKLLYDPVANYHPEYEGYVSGEFIKQADAVLLGYPVMYPMDFETRKNDLNIYEKVTRANGPAMTWAIHTVGILEFDELERAEAMFNRSYQSYIREPYKLWTDIAKPAIGGINFLTGMGGFLQSVVNGYGGYRLHTEKLVFNKPRPLPNSKGLNFIGLNLLENVFDVMIQQDVIKIVLKSTSSKFSLIVESGNVTYSFVGGRSDVTLKNSNPPISFTIKSLPSNCPLPLDKINFQYENNAHGIPKSFWTLIAYFISYTILS